MRTLLARPGADPPLSIDADLRPEGKGGALIRSLSAYRNYYSRWSSTWELQALVRADALAGDRRARRGADGRDRRPALARGRADAPPSCSEIRKLKARVEAERLPRGADPAKHTKLGPGGLADVEWTVQLLQLQHAHAAARSCGTPRTIVALRARPSGRAHRRRGRRAPEAGLAPGQPDPQPDHAGPRPRFGLAAADNRELAALAELLGYGPGESSHLLADYRRVTRRARGVVDRVFWGEDDPGPDDQRMPFVADRDLGLIGAGAAVRPVRVGHRRHHGHLRDLPFLRRP